MNRTLFAALFPALALVSAACGGDVTTTQQTAAGVGGAGGGSVPTTATGTSSSSSIGEGGADVATASATTGTTGGGGTGGVASTTSTGPDPATTSTSTGVDPDACQKACDKLENQCGQQNACQGANTLDCSSPLAQCVAKCVNESPCDQTQACFDQCDTTNVQGCLECTGNQCQQQAVACITNPACQAWFQCAQQCGGGGDPKCYEACDQANPGAKAQYEAIYACQCANCPTECGPEIDPCNNK